MSLASPSARHQLGYTAKPPIGATVSRDVPVQCSLLRLSLGTHTAYLRRNGSGWVYLTLILMQIGTSHWWSTRQRHELIDFEGQDSGGQRSVTRERRLIWRSGGRQRNSAYRPSRVNIMAQGLSTPDPSLSPTHLSIRRGCATTTHYTHHQVSLMVSHNTIPVTSLMGLCIGPVWGRPQCWHAKGACATPKEKERNHQFFT